MSLAEWGIDHPDDEEMREKMIFRKKSFLMSFALTMVHELAHSFVGFVRCDIGRAQGWRTPVPLTHLNYGVRPDGLIIGEAGRWLEAYIFGGSIEYYYDMTDNDGQVFPHFPHPTKRAY
jgi:hypothetical protein